MGRVPLVVSLAFVADPDERVPGRPPPSDPEGLAAAFWRSLLRRGDPRRPGGAGFCRSRRGAGGNGVGHHPGERRRLGATRAGHDGDAPRAAGAAPSGVGDAGAGHDRGVGRPVWRAGTVGVWRGGLRAVGRKGRAAAVSAPGGQRLRPDGVHRRNLGLSVGGRHLPVADDRLDVRLLRLLTAGETRRPDERHLRLGGLSLVPQRLRTAASRRGSGGELGESPGL